MTSLEWGSIISSDLFIDLHVEYGEECESFVDHNLSKRNTCMEVMSRVGKKDDMPGDTQMRVGAEIDSLWSSNYIKLLLVYAIFVSRPRSCFVILSFKTNAYAKVSLPVLKCLDVRLMWFHVISNFENTSGPRVNNCTCIVQWGGIVGWKICFSPILVLVNGMNRGCFDPPLNVIKIMNS